MGVFAADSPAAHDPVVVIDSTPVECGRSVETTRRSQLADLCGYGYSRSHSRWFWGMRLHLACSLDGTPRAVMLTSADHKERAVALAQLLPVAAKSGATTAVCDKGYAGRDLAAAAADLGVTILRPARHDEPHHDPHLAPRRSTRRCGFSAHTETRLYHLRAALGGGAPAVLMPSGAVDATLRQRWRDVNVPIEKRGGG